MTKFKKGEEVYLKQTFEKIEIDSIDSRTTDINEVIEKKETFYCVLQDESENEDVSVSSIGYSENRLTNINCINGLNKAKELINSNKYSINLFTEGAKEDKEIDKIIEESLNIAIKKCLHNHIVKSIDNIDYPKTFEDKSPVYCWDDGYTHYKNLRFYDAKNNSTFNCMGERSDAKWKNMELIPKKNRTQWMEEAMLSLED
jgi:hypothetical protein